MEGVSFARLDPEAAEHRFQRLRAQLGVSSFGINLIVLQPRQRGRIHRHERQEEVYLVLAGELTLVLEDGEHVLAPGELARLGPEVRRQIVNRGTERLELLALGGAGEHQSRDGRAYESFDEAGDGRPPQEVPLPADLPA
jgi:uncharacterized cupin superfamily protein